MKRILWVCSLSKECVEFASDEDFCQFVLEHNCFKNPEVLNGLQPGRYCLLSEDGSGLFDLDPVIPQPPRRAGKAELVVELKFELDGGPT